MKMGSIGCPETSVNISLRCVTFHKSVGSRLDSGVSLKSREFLLVFGSDVNIVMAFVSNGSAQVDKNSFNPLRNKRICVI